LKNTFLKTGDLLRAVDVDAIAAVPGAWRLQFSSQLQSARNPQEWQNNFALILHRDELAILRDALDAALAGSL
jgi:hypothetical protein